MLKFAGWALVYSFFFFFVVESLKVIGEIRAIENISGGGNLYNHDKVAEIYKSGDYSCNNSGDDKCPCIVDEVIFHRLLFKSSTIL